MKAKVGVIGSGVVAKVLAKGFQSKGYDVRIGSRDASKRAALEQETGIKAASFEDTAAHGEVIVLAVKGDGAEEACRMLGGAVAGKVVIDTTNPIDTNAKPDNGIIRYFTGPNESLMERLQKVAPSAHFVKAWNSVGNAFMVDPKFEGGPPTMFICGNDDGAKGRVRSILGEFGWDVEDLGKAEGARPIEALCQLWCAPGFLRNDWKHAYRVLR